MYGKKFYVCTGINLVSMQEIKLAHAIERYKLDKKVTAKSLFPKNKYPTEALSRVLRGESLLNSEQISRLALMTGAPIASLFTGEGWTFRGRGPDYEFTCGDFNARVHLDTGSVKIFDETTLFHEEILVTEGGLLVVPLLEFLSKKRDEYINLKAKKYD